MQKPSFAKLHALVAESSPHMATLICSMLRHLKLQAAVEAHSSSEAVALLSTRPFGVIMLDDDLQPVDGVTLTRALRSSDDSPNRATPVIMMSSVPDAARIKAARDAGVTEFLRKPFAAAHVETRLVSLLAAPRSFIDIGAYSGPDRRRRRAGYTGTDRRTER